MAYQYTYRSRNENGIVFTNSRQDPRTNIWNNLNTVKGQLINQMKRDLAKGTHSVEEQEQIKKRIVEVNKMSKQSIMLAYELKRKPMTLLGEFGKIEVNSDNYLEGLIGVADKFAIEFSDWVEDLKPAQRTSVWSKNGEISGLFNMDKEQLLAKYKREKGL